MATPKRGVGFGIVGVITGRPDELELTLYVKETRHPLAVVRGSPAYLRRALIAVGLPPALVPGLGKNGDRPSVAAARRQPSVVAPKRASKP